MSGFDHESNCAGETEARLIGGQMGGGMVSAVFLWLTFSARCSRANLSSSIST